MLPCRSSGLKDHRGSDHHFLSNITDSSQKKETKKSNPLTVLNLPSDSLVNFENFNSLVTLLRTLCICIVAFKKDLKAIFCREKKALALHAVIKADQMVHFEVEYRALSNGESINPKTPKAPSTHSWTTASSGSAVDFLHVYPMTDNQRFPLLVSQRSRLATLAIHDAHKRTNPSWGSQRNSGRNETSNLGHSGNEEGVSVHQEVRHVLPLQFSSSWVTYPPQSP